MDRLPFCSLVSVDTQLPPPPAQHSKHSPANCLSTLLLSVSGGQILILYIVLCHGRMEVCFGGGGRERLLESWQGHQGTKLAGHTGARLNQKRFFPVWVGERVCPHC